MYRKEDWAYANTRVRGTYVLHKGQLKFVGGVNPDGVLLENVGLVPLDEIEVQNFNLGYVNFRGQASYLSRKPMRHDWRQGLRQNNVVHYTGYSFDRLPKKCISKTLTCDFPSFDTCVKKVGKSAISLAWDRNWAIDSGLKVRYKFGRAVGKFEDKIVLDRNSLHLKEALEESLEASYEAG
jgi:hypothetical protein